MSGQPDPGRAEEAVVPLPMFPLGAVLFPSMPLPLHIFEPRYRAMTRDCLRSGREFGVVLIERGSEVGGGDTRCDLGTVARIVAESKFPDGRWALMTRGERRIRVVTWLPDDPYPLALVQSVGEAGPPPDAEELHRCERLVRRALALATEAGLGHEDIPGLSPAVFTLDPDPEVAQWQLCRAVPVGPLDHQRLLEAPGDERLGLLAELAQGALDLFAWRLGGR